MEKPDIGALFNPQPAHSYYNGRVCVTGDTAHASTPHQGTGARMAIEDAYVLSSLLGPVNNPKDIEAAFKAFDAVRRERTQKLATTSREAGQLYEMELEEVGDDIANIKANLDSRMGWIWNEDLHAEVEEGRRIILEHVKS
jgi:salicylate hydroxylase